MAAARALRIVVVKPSKYAADGWVERFRRGLMPNATVRYLTGLTPEWIGGVTCSATRQS